MNETTTDQIWVVRFYQHDTGPEGYTFSWAKPAKASSAWIKDDTSTRVEHGVSGIERKPYVTVVLPVAEGENAEAAASAMLEDRGITVVPGENFMLVTVRDRDAEPAWGTGGLIAPITRRVAIFTTCPVCGGPRGEPFGMNQCDDGAWYWVQGWRNPCGHIDTYADVLDEAKRLHLYVGPARRN